MTRLSEEEKKKMKEYLKKTLENNPLVKEIS